MKSNFASLKLKYSVSSPIKNRFNNNFYITSHFINVKFTKLELGWGRQILSGGYERINWNIDNASLVIFSKNNIRLWDEVNSFFIDYFSQSSGFNIYIEMGYPKRWFSNINPKIYYDHMIGYNIGFRKFGAFNNKNLVFGAEYINLIQSKYYVKIPSPNWYNNIKYDYHSYLGRRWAAHSGSDSDDMLLYAGFSNDKFSLIYQINYERHGVTFNFPPEVKIESRFLFHINVNDFFVSLNYENEYFEHYGFVDTNNNVWTESFEHGSIQRTQTILFSISSRINNSINF